MHETFTSHGSSISKSSPCGAARLYYLLSWRSLVSQPQTQVGEKRPFWPQNIRYRPVLIVKSNNYFSDIIHLMWPDPQPIYQVITWRQASENWILRGRDIFPYRAPSVQKVSQEQTPFYHSCRSVRSHRFPISFLINHRPRLTKAPLPRINSLLCGNVLYCENMFNFSGISSCSGNSRKFTRVRR